MGCGTSVLAIMAAKRGATEVLAIDVDEWCVENSIENVERNGCKHIKVQLEMLPHWLMKKTSTLLLPISTVIFS